MASNTKAKSLREQHKGSVPLTGSSDETFKWDAIGKELRGKLLKMKEGGNGGQFVMIDTGRDVVTASAPTGLADALDGVTPGTEVVIRYIADRPPKREGDSPFKVFEAVAIPAASARK